MVVDFQLHNFMHQTFFQHHLQCPYKHRMINISIHVEWFCIMMVFVTQTSTGTMVKRVPQQQMFVIEATLLENHFLPSSGFVMLMSVEDVLIS